MQVGERQRQPSIVNNKYSLVQASFFSTRTETYFCFIAFVLKSIRWQVNLLKQRRGRISYFCLKKFSFLLNCLHFTIQNMVLKLLQVYVSDFTPSKWCISFSFMSFWCYKLFFLSFQFLFLHSFRIVDNHKMKFVELEPWATVIRIYSYQVLISVARPFVFYHFGMWYIDQRLVQ